MFDDRHPISSLNLQAETNTNFLVSQQCLRVESGLDNPLSGLISFFNSFKWMKSHIYIRNRFVYYDEQCAERNVH